MCLSALSSVTRTLIRNYSEELESFRRLCEERTWKFQLTAVRITCFNKGQRRLRRPLRRLLDKPKQACQGLTPDG
jgi:hypothetical protein